MSDSSVTSNLRSCGHLELYAYRAVGMVSQFVPADVCQLCEVERLRAALEQISNCASESMRLALIAKTALSGDSSAAKSDLRARIEAIDIHPGTDYSFELVRAFRDRVLDLVDQNSSVETSARVETPDWRKLPFHPSLIPALRRAAKRGDLICGAAADALEAMTVPKITGAREIEYPERGGLSYEGTSQPNDRGNRATEETDSDRPAAPVSEERCQCGHSARAHHIGTTDIKGPCGTCSCMEWRSSAQETESGAPRGEAGDRAGPQVSPQSSGKASEQCPKGGEHYWHTDGYCVKCEKSENGRGESDG